MTRYARQVVTTLVLVTALCAYASATAVGEEQASAERVWSGYLYKDAEGRLQIGWPVVAMGVMAQPNHLVAGPLASRLDPLVSEMSSMYVFWNYRLAERNGWKSVPRVLVQLRGDVTSDADPNEGSFFGSSSPVTMHVREVVSVEFVSEKWLKEWSRAFLLDHSPFGMRMEEDRLSRAERAAKQAPKLIKILRDMRACQGASESQRELVASISAGARVVERERRRQEAMIRDWLVEVDKKYGLELEGLDDLGQSPPDAFATQKLFVEAENREAFVAAVRKTWSGDLGDVWVAYYQREGASTSMRTADVATIAERWTDAHFLELRQLTRDMVDR